MNDCIFCKIIRQEIPSRVVYENEHVYAFLDIQPVHPGHTLVIPKIHAANLLEVDQASLLKTVEILPKIARAIMEATGASGFNLAQNNGEVAGQTVHHLHFHIMPRHPHDGLEPWRKQAYPSAEEADAMAKRIQEKLL